MPKPGWVEPGDGAGERLRLYERFSNDWRLVMDPWQDVGPELLALSEEFDSPGGVSRYIAAINREELLQFYSFSTNSAVLREPESPGVKVKSMAFPADQYHLALGGSEDSVPTKLVLATITNDDVTFSDVADGLACVDDLGYSVGGKWLFGLLREHGAATTPKLYAWKVGDPYDNPKISNCPGCRRMVVVQEGGFNIAILTRIPVGTENKAQLLEFKLADNADPADSLPPPRDLAGATLFPGAPRALAASTVGLSQTRTPILVLATDNAVHLWDLKRLRAD